MDFTTKEIAHKIAAAACDKKAKDILLLNMENISPVTDYFIIASAGNNILVKAIADNIEDKLAEAGIFVTHKEGYAEGRWILMDYGNCVAHIFIEEEREFYNLEQLWADAPSEEFVESKMTDEKDMAKQLKYRAGDVVTLKVARLGEMGAFLDAGTGDTSDDILLHKLQQTEAVNVGDEVKVYLYKDPHGRLTASQKLPKMREGQIGYVKVLSVTKDGGFVDIGAERGVFLPYSEMRGHVSPGQLVWIKLYRDKTGRQAVSMRVDKEMQKASKPATGIKVGDTVTGTIYNNFCRKAFFIFTSQRFLGFLHRSEVPGGRLDFGQEITARVAYVRADGRLNLSMRQQKEHAMVADAEDILSFLKKRGGKMPYCDDTPMEIIKEKFGISKAAFKRALGRLLRQGLIRQEEGWTILLENPEDNKK